MIWERWLGMGGLDCWRMRGRVTKGASQWQARVDGEVWLWLNRSGEGIIWGKEDRMFLRPGMYAIFGEDQSERWRWTRLPGEHEVEVVVISRAWLARRIGDGISRIHPDFASWLTGGGRMAFAGLMTGPEKNLVDRLSTLKPDDEGGPLLVESRVLEWAALRLFRRQRWDPGAGFCQRVGRAKGVERALFVLRQQLDQSLDLKALGRQCGVSPTHLSRLVKKETGMTLREHQRRFRISHACDRLRAGESVTDAALEVGYQSLSHFAKAFREVTGKSPREWRGDPRPGGD